MILGDINPDLHIEMLQAFVLVFQGQMFLANAKELPFETCTLPSLVLKRYQVTDYFCVLYYGSFCFSLAFIDTK